MIVSAGRQLAHVAAVLMMSVVPLTPSSRPLLGGSSDRNMVNVIERNIAADWSVEEGKRKNIKWVADLGNRTFGSPVVAHGKVFVATNNAKPRDPMVREPKAVLMA